MKPCFGKIKPDEGGVQICCTGTRHPGQIILLVQHPDVYLLSTRRCCPGPIQLNGDTMQCVAPTGCGYTQSLSAHPELITEEAFAERQCMRQPALL